jgi:rubrerythrin
MALSERMCGILEIGIRKERDARDFYLRAAKNTNHPLGKKMFGRLADEEAKHEQLLASWSRGGMCPRNVSLPATAPDILKRAHATIDRVVKPETGDLEAIELGQKMEREAIAFYQGAAAKAEDPEAKDLFSRLKAEEDKHLALLVDLYEYMRNPNLWSIRDEGAHFDA